MTAVLLELNAGFYLVITELNSVEFVFWNPVV